MVFFYIAALAMLILGVLFGVVLAVASRVFRAGTDAKAEEIYGVLPDTNCGACGYGGCMAYAEAVARGGEKTNLCVPGGSETAEAVASIMGVKMLDASVAMRAVVHCQGDQSHCGRRADYSGIEECRAAHLLGGGDKACTYGCLGYGDCEQACPYDAIVMESGLPRVDPDKCTACGLCVEACPRDLITLLETRFDTYLGCSSHDSGNAVKDVCSVGCITCGLCVKKDPNGAIRMENDLPVLDYEKAEGDFSVAKDVCPMDCFVREDLGG